MRHRLAIATILLLAGPAAAQLSPDAGPVTGQGTLNDHDGNRGSWQLTGRLADGAFTGTIAMTLGGKALSVTMRGAYYENDFCVFRGENGRSRLELRGRCSSAGFGPGTVKGYFDGDREFNGEFTGTLRWGAGAATPAATGTLPTARLMCAYRERIGGNVAGDLARYETRSSSMVSLVLSAGTYRTRNTNGGYVVQGDRIRLTGGGYAGAVGRLRPDNGGAPAVYFDLAENRRADGVPIVDAWNTACVQQNR